MRSWTPLLILVLLLTQAFGADVRFYYVLKEQGFKQTGPATVLPSDADKFVFVADVVEAVPGSVGSASVTMPTSVTLTNFLRKSFGLSLATSVAPGSTTGEMASLAELNSAYPDGTFTITMSTTHDGSRSIPLSLTGSAYPSSMPQVSNYAASQAIDQASAFTLSWFPFANGTTNDVIMVSIASTNYSFGGTQRVYNSPYPGDPGGLNGTSTSLVIPANTLLPGTGYRVSVFFGKVAQLDTTSYPGAVGYAGYGMTTYMNVSTTGIASPPNVTTQPQAQTVAVGQNTTFTVVASGGLPISYQWWKGGAMLSGQTNTTLSLTNVQPADAGNYYVQVGNPSGTVNSQTAVLTIAQSPTITAQPQNQTVNVGGSATFTSSATGTPTPSLQWQRSTDGGMTWGNLADGGTFSGTSTGTLMVSGTTTGMSGHIYRLVASNTAGSAQSMPAILTINSVAVGPSITTHPQSLTLNAGSTATFAVTATGSTPLAFQWQFGNVVLGGQTNSTLAITNVQTANGGGYRVVVTNAYGALTSSIATLTVLNGLSTNSVLSLDGAGDYVSISSSQVLQPPNAITVEAWVYPINNTANNNPHFINKGDGQDGNSARTYELLWHDNVIEVSLFVGTSTYGVVSAACLSNRWTHVAFTYAAATSLLCLYTNGSLARSTTNNLAGQTLRQTSLPLVFGRIPQIPGTDGTGFLDEVRIWSSSRTGTEIQRDLNSTLSGTEANLVGYWHFDGGQAVDLTTNSNSGTLFGNAAIVPVPGDDVPHTRLEFAAPSLNVNGQFQFLLSGRQGLLHRIEATTDFATWTPLLTLTNTNGVIDFSDPGATGFVRRFYRGVKP